MKKLIITWIVVIILIVVFSKIFIPAYWSYRLDCGLVDEAMEGLSVGGYFNAEDSQISIFFDESDPNYLTTLKHENCHRIQDLENRSYSCDNSFGVYMNEAECYSAENLANFIYRRIYGK